MVLSRLRSYFGLDGKIRTLGNIKRVTVIGPELTLGMPVPNVRISPLLRHHQVPDRHRATGEASIFGASAKPDKYIRRSVKLMGQLTVDH